MNAFGIFVDTFLPGVAGFAVLFLVVPLAVRSPWPSSAVVRVFGTAVCVYAVCLGLGTAYWPALQIWHATAAYGLFFMLLWIVQGAVAKSVTCLIACNLAKCGGMAPIEVAVRQTSLREFTERVDLLVRSAQVEKKPDDSYELTAIGRLNVERIKRGKKGLGIHTVGLYGFD